MALHAIQNISLAFAVTREFLLPFELRRWLKLAVVAFFIGGGMSLPSAQFNTSGGPDRIPADGRPGSLPWSELPAGLPADLVPVVAAVIGVVVVLGLAFALVGAIMEFVFVESLRRGEVSVRHDWRNRWRQGLGLFGFRLAIGVPVLAAFLGWLALFFLPLLTDWGGPSVPFGVFLGGMAVLFVVGLVYGLVSGFTTVFVVPIMVRTDAGVLAGWRRLLTSIRTAWKQYLAYAVLGFVLTFVAGILSSLVLGLAAVVLLIPLGLVALVVHVAVSIFSTAGLVVAGFLAVVFVAAMVLLWALVQVPVLTYLRYYALLVLGDIDPSLDLVVQHRDAVGE